jgi:serine/threonine-protein kinase
MDPARRRRIEEICDAALDREQRDRAAFVANACGDDDGLRRQVEALLTHAQTAEGFLAVPIDTAAANVLGDSPDAALDDARFVPGRIFASRYRIVSLLGRGGMGEVYRADDLQVGHPVALKLLAAPGRPRHEEQLRRFVTEVRLARHIAHPNVCRVYDIGNAEGWHYLSMEYVDGETLASLLRRIGRMPPEKAMDIARQLCAGLAAAHDVGVLHRDINPSNIMIDGRGRVRLMDFGIAVPPGESRAGEIAGTPAYMSPEQLAGVGVSAQSDVYSLGLVIYELFTGRRVFPVGSLQERLQLGVDPPPLGETLREFDPRMGEIVRACLARDPTTRPLSADAIAACIPGGDVLTQAAAEGRLLSPDMLVAAGEKGGLRPLVAWGLLAATLSGMLVVASQIAGVVGVRPSVLPTSPAVLEDRARNVVTLAGGTLTRADSEYWFESSQQIRFYYRQSAVPLVPLNLFRVVTEADPAPNLPGMVSVVTDTFGRLLRYEAVLGQDARTAGAGPDWPTLFAQSGLDIRDFAAAEAGPAPVPSDARFAWRGSSDARLQVVAATLNGRLAYFEAFRDEPIAREGRSPMSTGRPGIGEVLLWSFTVVVFGIAGMLARSNIRRGEGDRRGALAVSAVIACGGLISALLHAHHVPLVAEELSYIFSVTAWSLLWGVLTWLVYMGLEPMLRRTWPAVIVSWARLLSGRWRDPLVGRDLLLGSLAGVANVGVQVVIFTWFQRPAPDMLIAPALDSLRSVRAFTNGIVVNLLQGILLALLGLFVLLLIRRLVRNDWVAALIYAIVAMPLSPLGLPQSVTKATIRGLTIMGVTMLVAVRLGLLAFATMWLVNYFVLRFPLTLDGDAWYFGSSTTALIILSVLALYGCVVAGAPQQRVVPRVKRTRSGPSI